jgi:3-oxoacyl-[acyl-carrier-protein] synthase III
MNDDTRKLLKIFGVAVTDSEAEAEKLIAAAAQLSGNSGKEEIVSLLKNASDLSRELNSRWQEITQRVFAIQDRLMSQLAETAARLQGTKVP